MATSVTPASHSGPWASGSSTGATGPDQRLLHHRSHRRPASQARPPRPPSATLRPRVTARVTCIRHRLVDRPQGAAGCTTLQARQLDARPPVLAPHHPHPPPPMTLRPAGEPRAAASPGPPPHTAGSRDAGRSSRPARRARHRVPRPQRFVSTTSMLVGPRAAYADPTTRSHPGQRRRAPLTRRCRYCALRAPTSPRSMRTTCLFPASRAASTGAATAMIRTASTAGLRAADANLVAQGSA